VRRFAAAWLLAAAACRYWTSPDTTRDAGTSRGDAPSLSACKSTEMMLSVPGSVTGTVVGAGRDVSILPTQCAELANDLYFEPLGEDVIVRLTGLTVGETYAVILDTHDDLSFYVLDRCPLDTNAAACSVFVDEDYGKESAAFVATSPEHYVVIDTAAFPFPITGNFTLTVKPPECTSDAMCTTQPGPVCAHFACRQCGDSFDCSSALPLCNAQNMCVASQSSCFGDDPRDANGGDDGPRRATPIAVPTPGARTIVRGSICDDPTKEADWFSLTLTSTTTLGFELAYPFDSYWKSDLDLAVYDAGGMLVEAAQVKAAGPERLWLTEPGAGHVLRVRGQVLARRVQHGAVRADGECAGVCQRVRLHVEYRAELHRGARVRSGPRCVFRR
jgi:hypothetical protein